MSTPVTADDVLVASRALLGVVARSIAPVVDAITIPQFRVLVILSTSQGPVRQGDLAAMLGNHPSTFSRTADRLVGGGWVRRSENPDNRRETLIELTKTGEQLVNQVTVNRQREITKILDRLSPQDRDKVLEGMRVFAHAAGEPLPGVLLPLGM
ncbi:MAG: MarR family transcriptional regulator [Candidatus Nanopelagicales bacterium]|nr:MarR family transcriptional regulator [Candidatus Nanopelagicales bacterium]